MATYMLNVIYYHNTSAFKLYYIHAHSQDVTICLFSISQNAPHTLSSQIHLHDTSCKFIPTSKFFVSIFTLKKKGEYYSTHLRITYAILH